MKQHIKLYEDFKTKSKSPFFESKEEIMSWLDEMEIKKYTINDDLSVDVKGDVLVHRTDLKHLPVRFGKVSGNFTLYGNTKMKTLEGCPSEVGKGFACNYMYSLTSLEYCPKIIKGGIESMTCNGLTSFVFSPKQPKYFRDNQCTYIYNNLGFTADAHIESLIQLDKNPKKTLERLKIQFPERYAELMDNEKIKKIISKDSKDINSISGSGFLPIEKWDNYLKILGVNNYTINDDGTVDVNGNVDLNNKGLTDIPIRFGKVTGKFYCSNNGLTSLKGCPTYVGDTFSCENNKLTSLEYGPIEVGSGFDCSSNKLTSLEYSPKKIGWLFGCNNNKLTSFVFASKEPGGQWNPCYKIYKNLGFTTEAHIEALLTLDPNPKETLEKLKLEYPERYAEIIENSEVLRTL